MNERIWKMARDGLPADGKWHGMDSLPTENGIYLVGTRKGTIMLRYFNAIQYYPFNIDPEHTDLEVPSCWAYIPDLSPEFTDANVIRGLKDGTKYY